MDEQTEQEICNKIEKIRLKYEKPSNIYFFTGAGISAPSGIPTFRDKGGLWEEYDLDVVCRYGNWQQNKEEVYKFYGELNKKYCDAEPNKAHKFIAEMQSEFGTNRVKIITQNIDTLFEKAGCKEVLHLHGMINHLQCTACGNIFPAEIKIDTRCTNTKCNSIKGVKPYVIMFGEKPPNYYKFRTL